MTRPFRSNGNEIGKLGCFCLAATGCREDERGIRAQADIRVKDNIIVAYDTTAWRGAGGD
jgi:hypothetical protein